MEKTVQWMHSRVGSAQQGWAGPGLARVINVQEQRPFFGPPLASGNPGPAVEIQLLHNDMKAWVDPAELVELEASGAPS